LSGPSGKEITMGKGNNLPSPLHFLETALAGCIGLTLMSICRNNGIDCVSIPIEYNVRIAAEKIKIEFSGPDQLKDLFMEAVENCYISKLVRMEKQFFYNGKLRVDAKTEVVV
jgi:uncharacterized OsmC-like protein